MSVNTFSKQTWIDFYSKLDRLVRFIKLDVLLHVSFAIFPHNIAILIDNLQGRKFLHQKFNVFLQQVVV